MVDGSHADWWVERQGRSTALVTTLGIFSLHHPQRAFTGRAWDAQSASLLLPARPPERILLLGLGGGTVARQCRLLFPRAKILAVEIEAAIVALARREFALEDSRIEVVTSSAEAFLDRTRSRFDAIVDDVWPLQAHRSRPVLTDPRWIARCHRLAPHGMLAINGYSRDAAPGEHRGLLRELRANFDQIREVCVPGSLVTVLVGGEALRDGRQVRQVLRQAVPAIRAGSAMLRCRSH